MKRKSKIIISFMGTDELRERLQYTSRKYNIPVSDLIRRVLYRNLPRTDASQSTVAPDMKRSRFWYDD